MDSCIKSIVRLYNYLIRNKTNLERKGIRRHVILVRITDFYLIRGSRKFATEPPGALIEIPRSALRKFSAERLSESKLSQAANRNARMTDKTIERTNLFFILNLLY